MLVEINNLILEVLMGPHCPSCLPKRKRTPLSKSFQPSGLELRGMRRESGGQHDRSKDTENVRCAGHMQDNT